MDLKRGRSARVWAVAGAGIAAAMALAACGGGSSGSPGSAGSGTSSSSGGSSSMVTVETHSGPLGTYLTDSGGRTLYLFVADTGSSSTCNGSCATFWPPLTTSGTPAASGGAKASDLGTTTRSDGSKQVTYAGHPLYYFVQDTSAGDMKGQGSTNSGAKWWIVSPSGQGITTAAGGGASSPASSSSSSSKGGGWA